MRTSLLERARECADRIAAERALPAQDPEFCDRERIFRVPRFSAEVVASVRRIAPQFDLRCDERSRDYFERDQNGACWAEYEALGPVLEKFPVPRRVLEIGPGMGRSTVFFAKHLGWADARFHLYDADGATTKYTILGPRFDDSFCGDLALLRHHLVYNGIENAEIIDAHSVGDRLARLGGPYDVIYSFYSVGFHWGIEHFLDEILQLLHGRGLAIFTVPESFTPFAALGEIPHRILPWRTAWPLGGHHKMLLLAPAGFPDAPPE